MGGGGGGGGSPDLRENGGWGPQFYVHDTGPSRGGGSESVCTWPSICELQQ